MALIPSLEIGKRGLLAQRFGLDVTGNNITNVNTPGYSRRQGITSETSPVSTSAGYIGTGAVMNVIRSFREEFYDREVRSNSSRQSAYASDETILQRIEAILAEPSDYGLNQVVEDFFNTWEELSLNPEKIALREHLLSTGVTLTDRFNRLSEQFTSLRDDIKKDISLNIESANQLITNIASLNKGINATYSKDQKSAQTLVDERELKLEELSRIAGIKVSQDEFGSVNVSINGSNVVTGSVYSLLKVDEASDIGTGERMIRILKMNQDESIAGIVDIDSGELLSQQKHYNITLDREDNSTGGYSIIKKLDDYANAIATNVNALTSQGFGLNDTTPTSPGRNFFTPAVGRVTSSTIALSADIIGRPEDIPISSEPDEPGNSRIALEIARLTTNQNFINSSTPSEFYSGYLGKIGQMSSEAVSGRKTTGLVSEQLNQQRESVIGVNLDEEAVNLIRFQKAFEASSRVINMSNEILQTIVNLGL